MANSIAKASARQEALHLKFRAKQAALRIKLALILATKGISVSTGNRKVGRIKSFSMLPVLTCRVGVACASCPHGCYAKAMLWQDSVKLAWVRNTLFVAFPQSREKVFADLDKLFSRIERSKRKGFRFHVSGDFYDMDYLDKCVRLCQKHPDVQVWTYTKKDRLVAAYLDTHGGDFPINFVCMLSQWPGEDLFNPYHLPTTMVIDSITDLPKGAYLCGGNCEHCLASNCGCVSAKKGSIVCFLRHGNANVGENNNGFFHAMELFAHGKKLLEEVFAKKKTD